MLKTAQNLPFYVGEVSCTRRRVSLRFRPPALDGAGDERQAEEEGKRGQLGHDCFLRMAKSVLKQGFVPPRAILVQDDALLSMLISFPTHVRMATGAHFGPSLLDFQGVVFASPHLFPCPPLLSAGSFWFWPAAAVVFFEGRKDGFSIRAFDKGNHRVRRRRRRRRRTRRSASASRRSRRGFCRCRRRRRLGRRRRPRGRAAGREMAEEMREETDATKRTSSQCNFSSHSRRTKFKFPGWLYFRPISPSIHSG